MGAGRRWRRLGAGVVVLLAMTGCSDADGDEVPTAAATPRVSETTTDSPSESPAPGPTPWPEPTRPAAMERDDIEGAKAAAEYFLALYPYVFATGDLDVWGEISLPECRFCSNVARRATELHNEGGFGLGGAIAYDDVRALPPDGEFEHFRVGIKGYESPSSSHSATGEELESAAGGEVHYTVGVIHDGEWRILGVVLEGQ